MPIPIQRVHESSGKGDFYIDYSMLLNNIPAAPKKVVVASNEDADLLIKLWASSDKISEDVYKIKKGQITQADLNKLKTHGFLTGGNDEVKFTGKAKSVITTMVLGENNAFQKQVKKKNYTEIMASMSLKGKKGYRIPKFAANSNLIRVT